MDFSIEKIKTDIPFNYTTIKTTKSRIDKGLLAIPVSLIHIFPKNNSKIFLINEFGNEETKNFTVYNSSSRECRIGGLKNFYKKYNIKDGDELVVQLLDDGKFRILPESIFKQVLQNQILEFEQSDDNENIDEKIKIITNFSNTNETTFLQNEFIKLANNPIEKRQTKIKQKVPQKEKVPMAIRKILLNLYKGKCQISNFTFEMKNGSPYFEIHHIKPEVGNHLKNLLVVSPNVHAQFTYANVENHFDSGGWLRRVSFNNNIFSVFQIIDNLDTSFEKKVHF